MNEADLAKFHAALAGWSDRFKKAPDEPDRQFYALHHLSEILSFLYFAGCGDALTPTQHIFKALGGRQLGHGDPLLDFPECYQGRKKRRSINETDFRAITAALMECFYKSGLSLDEAATETIRKMRLRGHTVAQVKKWREEMATELPTEHLGAFRYRNLTADLDSLSPEAARVKAIQILKSMR
jgi:hypothetical protein